ncbi:MAG: ATP-binding protein [Candidatus Accumulibacter necessarius]|jgi:PAS domain S-box-containing protein|uniref:hybrid sensor histidine kinase/response regulator n=1 Tax=Candidatus Accumulibacter necessarius TaxID=2954386 RepID=UPI002FC3B2C7
MGEPLTAGQGLREQAEALFLEESALAPAGRESLSLEDTERLLHELRVHQIELEMQNEELRQAQALLDTERARYFDLYDLAPVGYCTLSETGLILQSNLAAATLLGSTRAGLVMQPISRFILKVDQDIHYLHRRNVVDNGEPQACELRLMKGDGTAFWAHVASAVAQEANGTVVLRVLLSDVTQRKLAEAERAMFDQTLQDQNAELKRLRLVAETANLAKSEFLSSMSHELRTPLSAILGFAQLIESGSPKPTPSQQRSIDQILKAGWHLLGLINEVLDLAMIESGKLLLAMEPISLPEVIAECQDMVKPQAEQNEVSLSFAGCVAPCFVLADRKRLKQILINLLANAIKYNKAGGAVTMDCSPSQPDAMRISVQDTGAGLAPEQLAQLFQPFNRLGQEAASDEGTGIGLVVCKRLIEAMGGVIGVESAVGKGSVFWIELTLATEDRAIADTAGLVPVAQAPEPVGQPLRTVLYVEDNTANLMLVEEIVARRVDVRLLTARDGRHGIEIACASRPDVILMDISLPDISGVEALQVLAGNPATAHIPVIAISANAIPRDIEKGLAAGFFRYLTKPIRVNELLETLDMALQFARTGAGKRATDGASTPGSP